MVTVPAFSEAGKNLSGCAPCATSAWYEPQCVKMPEDVPPWWGTRKPLDLPDVEIPSLNLCTLKIAKWAVFKRVLMHKPRGMLRNRTSL